VPRYYTTLSRLTAKVAWLDDSLQRRLGAPYRVLLTVGLVIDIVHRVKEAPEHVENVHGWVAVGLAVVMEGGLLIHQVAELHHRSRAGRKAAHRRAEA
jgi:hypothetical protein